MPYVRKYVEDYFGKKVEGGVDPMQAVATGAAIQGGPKHLEYKLTRAKLEELIAPIVGKSSQSLDKALEGAKLSKGLLYSLWFISLPPRRPQAKAWVGIGQ